MLDDKRLVKMILESAQMLGHTFNEHGVDHPYKFKSSHRVHPCTVWTGASFGNVEWLMSHTCALELEYERRFDRTHRSFRTLPEAFDRFCRITTHRTAMTEPANCARNSKLGLDFTMYRVHHAYRLYLLAKWDMTNPTWKLQPPVMLSA